MQAPVNRFLRQIGSKYPETKVTLLSEHCRRIFGTFFYLKSD